VTTKKAKKPSAWSRLLWGVALKSPRSDPVLIGSKWAARQGSPEEPRHEGEPSRVLLFRLRRQARDWCRDANAHYQMHESYIVKQWHVTPVCVRETVAVVYARDAT